MENLVRNEVTDVGRETGTVIRTLAMWRNRGSSPAEAFSQLMHNGPIREMMMTTITWMSSNRLRLNSAKTQFIWLGTRQHYWLGWTWLLSLMRFPLLTFSSALRDLGV